MEKVVRLTESVVLEMINVLQAAVLTHPEHSDLHLQQMTMLEMLRCGLDSQSTDMTFQRTLEIYDQDVVTPAEFKAVEKWVLDPIHHVPDRTAQQFLGKLGKKIKHHVQ